MKEDYERKMRNVKKNATNIASSKYSDEQKCVTLYKNNGHQTNGWKLEVYYTLTNMNCKLLDPEVDMAQEIYNKNVSEKVVEACKLFTKGSLKIIDVEKLNYEKLQKSKSSTGHMNRLGKKKSMHKMEDELIEYIPGLRKNSKRFNSWIIWRKSLKINPGFCNYGKDHERMKTWFYNCLGLK